MTVQGTGDSFDWRNKGVISNVSDQGMMGDPMDYVITGNIREGGSSLSISLFLFKDKTPINSAHFSLENETLLFTSFVYMLELANKAKWI